MKKFINIAILLLLVTLIGFTLKRNKAEIAEEARLAERKVSVWPVVVEEVRQQVLSSDIKVAASLQPEKELRMVSQTQGEVIKVYKEVGDRVGKGELLVKVDDELIKAEMIVTQANHEQAQKDLERFENLSSGEAITAQQLEQIRLKAKAAEAKYLSSKKRYSDTAIKAPYSGTINRFFVVEGSFLGGGVPVCELVNVQTLKMTVKLSEGEMLRVKKGQAATVKAQAYPLHEFEGSVKHISVKADPSLQYDVTLQVKNTSEYPLKAGMFAEATFSELNEEPILVISDKALVENAQGNAVYVARGDQVFLTPIVTGKRSSNQVEVLEGISSGDMVVVSGQINLYDEASVQIKAMASSLGSE